MSKNQFLPDKVRRPREELRDVVRQLESFGLIVAGSWRREKDTVGDIDMLVRPELDFEEVVTELVTLLGYRVARTGTMKSEGTVGFKGQVDGLLLNLWRVPTVSAWGGMLLFSTGPMDLNVMMRSRAQHRGLKLSQYGLFNSTDDQIDGDCWRNGIEVEDGESPYRDLLWQEVAEKEIFDALDLQYLDPKQRETWRTGIFPQKQVNREEIDVVSSDGVTRYPVTLENGKAIDCPCKSFQYRHQCRHLAEAEAKYAQRS